MTHRRCTWKEQATIYRSQRRGKESGLIPQASSFPVTPFSAAGLPFTLTLLFGAGNRQDPRLGPRTLGPRVLFGKYFSKL